MNRAIELKNEVSIITDEKLLREKSVPTSTEECSNINLWEKLETTLSTVDGYGLAAIQIGYPIRASIINYEGKKIQLVNPEIVEFSGNKYKLKGEGCLSFPNKYVTTMRDVKIKVKDDINGEKEYEGWEAFIIQHEIDHMDGILFFDRALKPFKREKPKIGRNDPCRCGSGKKYKKCCGK